MQLNPWRGDGVSIGMDSAVLIAGFFLLIKVLI